MNATTPYLNHPPRTLAQAQLEKNGMNDFRKVVRLGTIGDKRRYSIFCKIELKDGRLSISGVEGPLPSGTALGACGQIDMHLRDQQSEIHLAPGWTRDRLARFFDVWKKWHLNGMQAGTPEQTAELEKHIFPGYPADHYTWASDLLAKAGLNPHNGYKYGSAWLRVEVPADVVAFLQGLPDTDITPAWV